jgi:hypothetical protein
MLAPRTLRRNDSTVTSRAEGHQANLDRNYLLLWKFWCGRTSGAKSHSSRLAEPRFGYSRNQETNGPFAGYRQL